MDEKRAKNLAEKFFAELEEQIVSNSKASMKVIQEDRSSLKVSSSRDWQRLIKAFEQNSINLCSYKLGTGKKLTLFNLTIEIADLNPNHNWEEDGLIGQVETWSIKAKDMIKLVIFHISKHCIYRIFERNYRTAKSKGSEYYSLDLIYNELKFVPIFSAILRSIFLNLPGDGKGILNGLSIIVPSPNGILLCEVSEFVIFVRTYINDDTMTEDQAGIRTQLLSIIGNNSKGLLNFFPFFAFKFGDVKMDASEFMLKIISSNLVHIWNKNFDITQKSCGDDEFKLRQTLIKYDEKYENLREHIVHFQEYTWEEYLPAVEKIVRQNKRAQPEVS